ncbi:hypothetical protein [Microvirga puerhi]|uniref:Lipoprotein n=1 Tax=Microvirga puerhi TaxID=2876078 RepID=A0ABS7VPL8_9HYPH|nr:hypothetical protein [Microvirga puerhi]MBZ6077501.1 hypothetical protein [Microvirga puerhi]
MIRTIVLAAVLPLFLTACVTQQQREQVAACNAQTFKTNAEKVVCLNAAETSLSADLKNKRLELARRVDTGQISLDEGNQLYRAQVLEAREQQRRTANAGMMGAMIGAGIR